MALTNQQILEYKLQIRAIDCRDDFLLFRKTIHPKAKWGWFQVEATWHLSQFYCDLIAGKRPKLVIEAPPQHGKSEMVVDFIAWLAGKNPDLRTIYTSFSERLGIRANLKIQRIMDSEMYSRIFPDTVINKNNAATISSQHLRNRTVIEYCGREGFFRNTTVEGSITGESLDLGVIDDPVRGRKDANSITKRNSVWEWLTDDFFTRFSEDGALLCILTRWHVDDPIGRLIAAYPAVKVCKYLAIADKDEANRKEGEALFPEHKSIDFLLERKALLGAASWMSLYQQSPIVLGGEIIKGEWFGRYTIPAKIKYRRIYADTAQKTGERHDYSVFQCWGYAEDGKIYLLDMIRGKWEAHELKRRAVDFWAKHAALCNDRNGALQRMNVEDKASGTGLIQDIRKAGNFPIFAVQRNKDKLTRVMDVVGYIESCHVMLPNEAPYINDFIDECENFTADDSHAHDDQIDPLIDAIVDMLQSNSASIWERLG